MIDPDWDLVRRCQRASGAEFEEAYRELFVLYRNRVYTVCLRVTGNEEDAMDAAQETMVTLARRVHEFGFRSRFSSWVYRIAVNAAIDVRRRRLESTHGSVSTALAANDGDDGPEPVVEPESSDPLERASSEEARNMVQAALSSMNPKFSGLLVLRYVQGLSYEEIAEVLECNLGTVKSRLNRAHAALRDILSHQHGEGALDHS